MKFLIIGVGSSARRFATYLLLKKHSVTFFHHRLGIPPMEGCKATNTLSDIKKYDAVIISSPTATHLSYTKLCIDKNVPVLVEKPFSHNLRGVANLMSKAEQSNSIVMTGFNLRFLPIVKKIKKYLDSGKLGTILHADLSVGQYLPTWRPWLDYRDNYSASFEKGGGVALDLIHEVDLAYLFFENISLQLTVSEKLSTLEINTEDFVQFRTKHAPYITVTMDYLNHIKTRQYRIIGSEGSIECDIFNQRFVYQSISGKTETITSEKEFDIKNSFSSELDEFTRLAKKKKECVISERALGIDALRVVLKARKRV